jgi:ribosome-associated heat shock protein Hsp15
MDSVRVDKWLWAARFFKTRALATEAVLGGHVQVNGVRVKPSKDVRIGDALQVRIGTLEWIVDVRALADRRGSATVARSLYESDPTREARAAGLAARLAQAPISFAGRPTERTAAASTRYGGRSRGRAETASATATVAASRQTSPRPKARQATAA